MKNILKYSILMICGLVILACKTEIVEPIDLDALETGGYVRTVSPYPVSSSTFNYKITDMGGTKMEIVAEAVTPNKGADFASYELFVKFVDATASNGTKTTSILPLKTILASAFTKDAITGYPRATITVTGIEALAASKLVIGDIAAGDRFEITGTMKLTNGKTYNAANTGANITGGAFYSSPFFYRVNVLQ
ncbi:hypothetical protein [Arcicella lustrica]|uniref:DUF5008 domain-containing protein n=1 Tax=Arcicella lustrica TaxID=2984196 RepID=A0ABU5SNG1_9BACT|nr:hypothetical protein [Arcicella sp. DC25W]MEA5428800.1 hypothetical protein [Arcicella sp. DC25W]